MRFLISFVFVLFACQPDQQATTQQAAQTQPARSAAATRAATRPASTGPAAKPVVTLTGNTLRAGPLQYAVPSLWPRRQEQKEQQLAAFDLPPAAGDPKNRSALVLFGPQVASGANTQQRLRRLAASFTDGTADDVLKQAKVERFEVGGVAITTFDFTGTFRGGKIMQNEGFTPVSNYRVAVAMYEADGILYQLRIAGPAATIAMHVDAFNQMVRTAARAQ